MARPKKVKRSRFSLKQPKDAKMLKSMLGLPDAGQATQCQSPAVDVHGIEEYNYRSGLVAAMECILRELR
jgi:hypothetical protein